MLDDMLKTPDRLIGMVQPLAEDSTALHHVGCAGRVVAFSETDDGRYMISLMGISRFRIEAEETGFTPYRRARVSWSGYERDFGPEEVDENFDRASFMELLARYFRETGLSTDWDSLKQADDELLINSLSMLCPFDPEDKQALLEAPTLKARRETMATLIEFALRGDVSRDKLQ